MSITRKRAGRRSWETRMRFSRNLTNFVQALAAKEWKFDAATTKAMVIERSATVTGKKEVITFNQAYGELSMWLDKSFANISEDGLSDMLAETFFQGARLVTGKAEYRLWKRTGH